MNCACLSLSISLINDVNQVTWVSWSITCKPIGELQLSNMTNLEECGESMEGGGGGGGESMEGEGGGCSPHCKRRRLQSVEVCVYVYVRAGTSSVVCYYSLAL